jgi:hypothetical protein
VSLYAAFAPSREGPRGSPLTSSQWRRLGRPTGLEPAPSGATIRQHWLPSVASWCRISLSKPIPLQVVGRGCCVCALGGVRSGVSSRSFSRPYQEPEPSPMATSFAPVVPCRLPGKQALVAQPSCCSSSGWAESLKCTRANLPEACPVDRIVMRLRLPSLLGRERSWQIPRILESFAKIAGPRTTRRMVSAVRVEHHWHLQLDILSAILSLERRPGGDARRRASTLE